MTPHDQSSNGWLGKHTMRAVRGPRAWWQRRGYVVMRALVALVVASLGLTVCVSWRSTGRAMSSRGNGAAVATPAITRPGIRISAVDPYAETVYVLNAEDQPVDLTGWRVVSAQRDRPLEYYFPPSHAAAAGGTVRLHSARGTDSETDLYWSLPDGTDVWPWRSGVAILYDPEGREASRFSYAHGSGSVVVPVPSPVPGAAPSPAPPARASP